MAPHPFQNFTEEDTTELAYHLHYEHGFTIAAAWDEVYAGTAIRTHRGIHA
jgi:hypothetical protein